MSGVGTDRDETSDANDIAGDLAFGAEAIAEAMGLTRRQIYHIAERSHLPLFRIGTTICARRSTLRRWLDDQERAARGDAT